MQYLDFDEALLFFLAGSGKEQERKIYLYCIAMWSTLINISIVFVVLLIDETKIHS